MATLTVAELIARGNPEVPGKREVAIRVADGEIFNIGPQFPRDKPGFVILETDEDGNPILPERESQVMENLFNPKSDVIISPESAVSEVKALTDLSDDPVVPEAAKTELTLDVLAEAGRDELLQIAADNGIEVDKRLGDQRLLDFLANALGV